MDKSQLIQWEFPATVFLLFWCLIITLVLAPTLLFWSKKKRLFHQSFEIVLPALVIGPMLVVVFYRVFDINLLYPVQISSSNTELMLNAIAPAWVLVLASGLLFRLKTNLSTEYQYWSKQSFVTVSMAMGLRPDFKLAWLVIIKSLLDTWNQTLPWVMGEILIVEHIFSAPGLGTNLWHLARERKLEQMMFGLFQIALIYGFMSYVLLKLQRRLGRLLESYQ